MNDTSVVAISVIAYFVGYAIKLAGPRKIHKFIPVVCGSLGLVLGLIAYFTNMPIMTASDPISAAAIGLASGLSATGVNQIYKQLKESDDPAVDPSIDEPISEYTDCDEDYSDDETEEVES